MDVIKELQNSEYFIMPFPKDTSLAMAYVPFQNAGKMYSAEQGVCVGTLFPELNKPFDPKNMSGGDEDD